MMQRLALVLAFLAASALTPALVCQQAGVDVGVLKSQLRPLDKTEVEIELGKWLVILKAKAVEVSAAEVASMSAVDAAESDRESARAVLRRSQRDALILRVKAVIDAYEAKNGDGADARAYVQSLIAAPPITGVRAAWTTFRAWIMSSEGGLAVGKNIIWFLVILFAFKLLANLLGRLIDRGLAKVGKTSDLLRSFSVNSVRKVTMFIGLVIALSQLGVDIGPLLAAIGAAGFVIAFALQRTLSNFAAGVMIMIYRPYDLGDWISAAGVSGSVGSMTLVSTTMKTGDNQTIVVPNGKIWGDVITNVTANATRRVDMVFGIGYDDDMAVAEAELRDLVENHPKVLKDPAPVIRVNELADSSVNFIVRPWALAGDYWQLRSELLRAVKERFDAKGISIPYPQQDVHIHQAGSAEQVAP